MLNNLVSIIISNAKPLTSEYQNYLGIYRYRGLEYIVNVTIYSIAIQLLSMNDITESQSLSAYFSNSIIEKN